MVQKQQDYNALIKMHNHIKIQIGRGLVTMTQEVFRYRLPSISLSSKMNKQSNASSSRFLPSTDYIRQLSALLHENFSPRSPIISRLPNPMGTPLFLFETAFSSGPFPSSHILYLACITLFPGFPPTSLSALSLSNLSSLDTNHSQVTS